MLFQVFINGVNKGTDAVEQLCKSVSMRQSQLHRKLEDTLTGCSPDKLIRLIRFIYCGDYASFSYTHFLLMVAIAALLIPLHHRLEHWVRHKLIVKNKKLKLVAAKKTVAGLEAEMIRNERRILCGSSH